MNRHSPKPRFEFRVFGHHFGRTVEALRASSEPTSQDEMLHTYLLSATNYRYNIKINHDEQGDDTLEVKVLLREQQGVECWAPYLELPMPLTSAFLHEFLFAWLEIELPLFRRSTYNTRHLLQELIIPNPHLRTAKVCKKRTLYEVGNSRVEIATLCVDDRHEVHSVAIDADDAADVLETVEALGLQSFTNLNYLAELNQLLDRAAPFAWVPPIRTESLHAINTPQLVFMS